MARLYDLLSLKNRLENSHTINKNLCVQQSKITGGDTRMTFKMCLILFFFCFCSAVCFASSSNTIKSSTLNWQKQAKWITNIESIASIRKRTFSQFQSAFFFLFKYMYKLFFVSLPKFEFLLCFVFLSSYVHWAAASTVQWPEWRCSKVKRFSFLFFFRK